MGPPVPRLNRQPLPALQFFARSYWCGHSTSERSSFAARSGQYGSLKSSRARKTTSACPVARMCSAWYAERIIPTAPVSRPASLRTCSASCVW